MRKIFDYISSFVIIGLIFIICFERYCSRPDNQQIKIDTVYQYHTDIFHTLAPKPYKIEIKPVLSNPYNRTIQVPGKPEKVDTAAILADYMNKKSYSDTYKFKYGEITVKEEVQFNSLLSREVIPNLRIPKITETKKAGRFLVGAQLKIGEKPGVAPSAMYIDKKGRGYSGEYDFVNQDVYLGLYWSLW